MKGKREDTNSVRIMNEIFREWRSGCLKPEETRLRLYCTAQYPRDVFPYCRGCEYNRRGR